MKNETFESGNKKIFSYSAHFNRIVRLFRDGPFDIQGGGAGIFPHDKLFFLSFSKKLFFFKVNRNKFFIFLKNNTLKSEKCKRKQHIE